MSKVNMTLLRSYLNRSLRKCITCRNLATQSVGGPNAENREDIRDLRNIGIIAHIDAGKTTTTERILYYSGITNHLGDVDHGDTITDYMEEERNRGITITSAAVTYHWKKHRVNLIDTPGHVDFTIEVERALRVLDGAVTILDSSAGVEAQTVTVWRQATKHNIPSIIYLNKLDKIGSSVDLCLQSIRQKLHTDPFLINFPYGKDQHKFKGLVDIVDMVKYEWDLAKSPDGRKFSILPLTEKDDGKFWEYALKERTNLIGQLSDSDEKIADEVLLAKSMDEIKAEYVKKALRHATIKRQLTPVMCGSSLKNKGVQLLMNAVYDYLPSPNDRELPFLQYYGSDLCAYAFKTIHDRQKNPQTFFRIYSGSLHSGSDIHNINRNCKERVKSLSRILANDYSRVSVARPGDIVCVPGLQETRTGDTITSTKGLAKLNPILRRSEHKQHEEAEESHDDGSYGDNLNHDVVLAGLQVPSPVYFCSVEPPSLAYQNDLDTALACLQREDPSLKVEVNQETGQTILSGMGELHLEVIKHRILSEFKVDAYMGPLQIAYRETINDPVTHTETLDSIIGGKKQHATVTLTVQPSKQMDKGKVISYEPHSPEEFITSFKFRRTYKSAVENGIRSALSYGPILNFPVINVDVILHSVDLSWEASPNVAAAAASKCLHTALRKATLHLMEPIMKLEISTDEEYSSAVLHDLASRRARIEHVHQTPKDSTKVIQATVPLSELSHYSNSVRKITHGQTSLSMEFSHYEEMSEEEKNKAIEEVTGFPVNPSIFNSPQ